MSDAELKREHLAAHAQFEHGDYESAVGRHKKVLRRMAVRGIGHSDRDALDRRCTEKAWREFRSLELWSELTELLRDDDILAGLSLHRVRRLVRRGSKAWAGD